MLMRLAILIVSSHLAEGELPARALSKSSIAVVGRDTTPRPDPRRPWMPAQLAILRQGIDSANAVAADTTFLAVLREMEDSQEFSWRGDGGPTSLLNYYPRSQRARPVSWLLSQLSTFGQFLPENITAIDSFKNSPSTRASTPPCGLFRDVCRPTTTTTFRRTIVSQDDFVPLVNTLAHERMHSFGHQHWRQDRPTGLCEAPYVMGDLAEFILERRAQGRAVEPRQYSCPALQRRLRSRGIAGLAPGWRLRIQQPDSAHLVFVDYRDTTIKPVGKSERRELRTALYVDTSRVTRVTLGVFHVWIHEVWRVEQFAPGSRRVRYKSTLDERDVECLNQPRFRRITTTYHSRNHRTVHTTSPPQPQFNTPTVGEGEFARSLCRILLALR